MPITEKYPSSTTVIVAGWASPTNAYSFNNTYTYSETDLAEQEYLGYDRPLTGNEVIDKVFVKLKWKNSVTTVSTGDTAASTCSVKVWDGSAWQTYQVTAQNFAVSTTNDESLVDSTGDDTNNAALIDITSYLDTLDKLNSAKTRLLSAITETKTVTLLLAGYIACVVGDVGKTVTDDAVAVGTLVSYDNVARTWVITTSAVIADSSVMAITAGTGAGTATGVATGITVRWSVDAIIILVCYHIVGGVFPSDAATTTRTLDPKVKNALLNVKNALTVT